MNILQATIALIFSSLYFLILHFLVLLAHTNRSRPRRGSRIGKTNNKGPIWHFLVRLGHGTEAGFSGCPVCQCAYRCHCNTLEAPE